MLGRIILCLLGVLLISNTEVVGATISESYFIDLDSLTPAQIKQSMRQKVKEYKIGIALSGGGARGLAQIGILSELEKAGIEIDLIAGTSMGGIIGGLYALGMEPTEIEQVTRDIDWNSFFSDKPKRGSQLFTRRTEIEGELLTLRFHGLNPRIPTALTSGQKLLGILNSLTQIPTYFSKGDFSNLECKLAIVSTDIVSGEKVVFTSGSLVTAMRATTGVPLAFTPFEDGDRLLMDGGLLDPIPTDEVRKLGADFVIAINTTSTLLAKEDITDPIDIANQTTTILSAATRHRLLAEADFVITPDLQELKATDFSSVAKVIEIGRHSVKPILEELLQRLEKWNKSLDRVTIDSVAFTQDDLSQTGNSIFRPAFDIAGQELSYAEVDNTIHELFSTGKYLKLDYNLLEAPNNQVLRISTHAFPVITGLIIEGNQVFSDLVLRRISGFVPNSISSSDGIIEIYDNILRHYQFHGYDLVQIKTASLDISTGTLTIRLDEGRIVGISVEGNNKTRWWVVLSYFPLKTNRLYSKFKAAEGVRNIYACGLFENVSLRLAEKSGGVWITVVVKEKDFTYTKLGARYHEEFHPESFLKLGYAHLGGTGNEVSLYARFSEKRKHFQAQMRADRIRGLRP